MIDDSSKWFVFDALYGRLINCGSFVFAVIIGSEKKVLYNYKLTHDRVRFRYSTNKMSDEQRTRLAEYDKSNVNMYRIGEI